MFYRNNKTLKVYKLIDDLVIDTTSGAEERLMVLYKDKQGKKYVRERTEFYQKFSPANLRAFE